MSGNEFDELTLINNELINAQRELQKKNRELESLNARKNEAMGIVAHDLRNPLVVIKMYSTFLLEDATGSATAEQREMLATIRETSESMLEMVNDLLDFSAIESGKLRLERRSVDLIELVTRNVARNRMLARHLEIALLAPPSNLLVELDPGKFEQVLNNLITNAIKYSTEGAIEVGVNRTGAEAVVSVKDEGPGIASDELQELFVPFRRGKGRGAEGDISAGLGLAIVKRIVEGHGGRILVDSQPSQGTTFSVRLPLQAGCH